MARPRKDLSDDQVDQIERLAPLLNLEQIAHFLGITDRTLKRRMRESPKVLSRYQKGKARAIGSAAESLLKQVRDGNLGATIFYLKTQGRWKETEREMPFDELNDLSDAELQELAEGKRPED